MQTEKTETLITTETKICKYLVDADICTFNTAKKRLISFKERMFYCSPGCTNPMFLHIANDKLKLSDEFIYIYELMYKYFCLSQLHCIEFDPCTLTTYNQPLPAFTWSVPANIMPWLSICIATTNIKKKDSIHDFYDNLYDNFQYILELPSLSSQSPKHAEELYNAWIEDALKKSYFIQLENIYQTYSSTLKQKESLREVLTPITHILIHPQGDFSKYNQSPIESLSIFSQQLELKLSEENTKDIAILYPRTYPLKIKGEYENIKILMSGMLHILDSFMDFIELTLMEHAKNELYPIAIDNCSQFEEESATYIQHLETDLENLTNNLSDIYISFLKNDEAIAAGIDNKKITFNKSNAKKHAKLIKNCIKKYFNQILKSIKKFIKKVHTASNPKTCKKLVKEIDYFSEFKSDIARSKSNLDTNLQKLAENKTPNIIYYHDSGLIETLKYPSELSEE